MPVARGTLGHACSDDKNGPTLLHTLLDKQRLLKYESTFLQNGITFEVILQNFARVFKVIVRVIPVDICTIRR